MTEQGIQPQYDAEELYQRAQSEKAINYEQPVIAGSYAKWMQDNKEKLVELSRTLMGMYVGADGKVKTDPKARLMEDKGVRAWIGLVGNTYLDKNLFMTKIEPNRVMKKLRFIGRTLGMTAMLHKKDWKIDAKNLRIICFSTLDIIEFAMKRAEMGNEKKFMMGVGSGAFQFDEDERKEKRFKIF